MGEVGAGNLWNERDREVDFVVRRGTRLYALEVKSGRASDAPGLNTFKARFPEAVPLRIGGQGADMRLQDFFENGLKGT